MKGDTKSRLYLRFDKVLIVAIALLVSLINRAWAIPSGPHHSFLLTGPWELVIKTALDDQGLRFPLTVSDENKPNTLDGVLPIIGTPIEIRLEQYVPDLKWDTTVIEDPNGGIVATLTVKGTDLKQDFLLNTDDPAKQLISSSIGNITIKKLYDANAIEKLMQELSSSQAVGIVSIWLEDSNSPLEFIAEPQTVITIPKSKYKLSVLEYLPHFSIDTETKKVVSQSDKPINPAIKVLLDDGKNTYEQWLWSKFPSSPHKQTKLPLRVQFTDFDLSSTKGNYILAVAGGSEPWLISSKEGKTQVEKVVIGCSYPFTNKEYSFSINKIVDGATIKTDWKNNSKNLLHPAIIAKVEDSSTSQQVVLEFNKPYHYTTKSGTMIFLYRRRPELSKAPNLNKN